ncbi:transporter [Paraburkholderia agricolaris]|uniref:Transporter n=1 Tax=Paraburkholderia agricolaris TaxID=2152888 RepID=A0ABW9A2F4_9BURK
MKNTYYPAVALSIAILTSLPGVVSASEGTNYGGPTGGTDIGAAYLPPVSGFYGGIVGFYGTGDKYYDNSGHVDPNIQGKLTASAAAVGLLYVYPFKLLGGTLGTTVQGVGEVGSLKLNGESINFKGFADVYSDILMWSKYLGDDSESRLPHGLTVKLAYSMIFPVGKYNTTDLTTTGRNVYYFVPNIAFTYLTQPNFIGDGLEMSAHFFFNVSSKNSGTNYKSGSVGSVNFALSERIGRWQAGLAGNYATQFSDDYQDGTIVQPAGRRYGSLTLGPVVSLDIPAWKSNLKFKAEIPVYTRNELEGTILILVYTTAF